MGTPSWINYHHEFTWGENRDTLTKAVLQLTAQTDSERMNLSGLLKAEEIRRNLNSDWSELDHIWSFSAETGHFDSENYELIS